MKMMKIRAFAYPSALIVLFICGCSSLRTTYDPRVAGLDQSKVYLEYETVSISPEEVDYYACITGVLVCSGCGQVIQCRCAR
jgi:hypothetical protein